MRTALRKVCEHCKLVKRGRKNLVICSASPKHKQRQGLATLAGAGAPAPPPGEPSAAPGAQSAKRPLSFSDAIRLWLPAAGSEDL